MTGYEWECNWIDQHSDRYEGPLHIAAVKRFIKQRYDNNALIKGRVEYLKKGTIYTYLGMSFGAGWRNTEKLHIYCDLKSGQLFHRERDDFNQIMRILK